MPGLENYIPVKQRIHDMRSEHPDWGVTTTLSLVADYWHATSTITDDTGRVVSNGHAIEKNTKPFDAEKAETSAVGRALVFAGWTDSLELSQEEVERSATVRSQTKKPKVKPKPVAKTLTADEELTAAKVELVKIMGDKDAAAAFWHTHEDTLDAVGILQLAFDQSIGKKEQ